MNDNGLSDGLFQAFLSWLYQSSDVSVPSDYHARTDRIWKMISFIILIKTIPLPLIILSNEYLPRTCPI